VALDPSVILHLPIAGFNAIVEAEPRYWRNFGIILSQHLRTALHYLEDVASEPSHIRIGRLLMMMATGESEKEPSPGAVVEISQEDLATTTGMSRQSANKALKRLEDAGLIERRYGAVILADPARLANVGR
jgi:CRP-like cAMP-binding protein